MKLKSHIRRAFSLHILVEKIEALSLGDLLVIALLALTIASEYFYIATPYGHGMNLPEGATWSWKLAKESFYFSTVTFTTLGYGDISPVGFGRLIAMLLVIGGLSIISLTIGKLASERQQAHLLLLHTSDCQRRISGYVSELDNYIQELKFSIANNDSVLAKAKLKELKPFIEAISNYVAFHSFQSNLIEFGNDTAITILLRKLEETSYCLSNVFKKKKFEEPIGSRCLALAGRIAALEALVVRFQEKKIRELKAGSGWRYSFHTCLVAVGVSQEVDTSKNIVRSRILFSINKNLHEWSSKNQSEWLLNKVLNLLPDGERASWEPHQHKKIAKELKISNSLASSCISVLIERGLS